MILCSELINFVEDFAPAALAEEWDNVGLLIGSEKKKIGRILLSLDLCNAVIEEGIQLKADVILTHHPILFSPTKRVIENTNEGKKIIKLIQNDICHIAVHTNLDSTVGGVNDVLADTLGLKEYKPPVNPTIMGRIGEINEMPFKDFICLVKERLSLPFLKYTGSLNDYVKKIAVCGGNGGDYINGYAMLGADVLVTSDVKYHQAQEAYERGFKVLDTGHFETENLVLQKIKSLIENRFKNSIEVMITQTHTNSFWSYV